MNTTNPEQTIFVVVAYGGEWEEAWQSNHIAAFDMDTASAYIATREAKAEAIDIAVKQLYKQLKNFELKYIEAHGPCPESGTYEELPWPRWESGQVITDQMREDRWNIKLENKRRSEEAWAPYTSYQAAKRAAEKLEYERILESLGITKEQFAAHDRLCGDKTKCRIDALKAAQPK